MKNYFVQCHKINSNENDTKLKVSATNERDAISKINEFYDVDFKLYGRVSYGSYYHSGSIVSEFTKRIYITEFSSEDHTYHDLITL